MLHHSTQLEETAYRCLTIKLRPSLNERHSHEIRRLRISVNVSNPSLTKYILTNHSILDLLVTMPIRRHLLVVRNSGSSMWRFQLMLQLSSSSVLYFFEICITLSREVSVIWNWKFIKSTWLYIFIRYATLSLNIAFFAASVNLKVGIATLNTRCY